MLLQISAGVNVGLWVQIGNNRQGVNKKVCATCASVLLHWVCIYKVLTGNRDNPVACDCCTAKHLVSNLSIQGMVVGVNIGSPATIQRSQLVSTYMYLHKYSY